MLTSFRTREISDISESDIGKEVSVAVWVKAVRDMGSVIFLSVFDSTGTVQLVFEKRSLVNEKLFELAKSITKWSTVSAKAVVRKRPEEAIEKTDFLDSVELYVLDFSILSLAGQLPLQVEERSSTEAGETVSLRYRYLKLRDTSLKRNIALRSELTLKIRNFLSSLGFIEIETPILSKSSPEGARDFIVPSRINSGQFYALPQSPQIYKQLLMASSFESYFQIARCFRDEDFRANRQAEFTQLDIEMSFVEQDDIFSLIENLLKHIFKEVLGKDLKIPCSSSPHQFDMLPYDEAFERYGTDKPDRRFDMIITDLTDLFRNENVSFISKAISSGAVVGAILLKGKILSRKEVDDFQEVAKQLGIPGILIVSFKDSGKVSSVISNHLSKNFFEKASGFFEDLAAGDSIFIVVGHKKVAWTALGRLRVLLADKYDLVDKAKYDFLWVTEWPLFEWSEEDKRFYSLHHPFTSPVQGAIESLIVPASKLSSDEILSIKARAYDLVCNGEEVGGGSIRINNEKLQLAVFKLLGIDEDEANRKFGALLSAQRYGLPPHGGVAFGLERILMLLLGTDSIADVIAFPKTGKGRDFMLDAPSFVSEEQLRELELTVKISKDSV